MAETVSIKFLKWSSLYEKERPFQIFTDLRSDSEDRRTTNLDWDDCLVNVRDFRDISEFFNLDTHGFASFPLHGFDKMPGEDFIRQRYLPAIEDMLKSQLEGVGTVFIFDWRVSTTSSQELTICCKKGAGEK